jgi:hypothetical protein
VRGDINFGLYVSFDNKYDWKGIREIAREAYNKKACTTNGESSARLVKRSSVELSMLGGIPVPTAWRVLGLRMEERPPDMEVSCEYIE